MAEQSRRSPKTFEIICIDKTLEDIWRHKRCVIQSSDHGVSRQSLGVGLGQSWETYPKVSFVAKQTKGRYKGTTNKGNCITQ